MARPGRRPIGERAMTPAEKQRRYRERKFGNKQDEAKAPKAQGQLTRKHSEERGRPDKPQAEIAKLKSEITKLKMALQEDRDTAKLRRKIVDQQAEMASLRRSLRQIAKERDEIAKERDRFQVRLKPRHGEAERLLTRSNYGVIIKALHPDRSEHVTTAELAAAERLITGLRPLFIETD